MAGAVSTFSGTGHKGLLDGSDSSAQFNCPRGMAMDAQGNLFVAEEVNHCIRKITPQGVVSTLAGSGHEGFVDGSGSTALFSRPSGVAVDRAGNVLVADSGNNRIRRVTPQGVVSTLAGSKMGFKDGPGPIALFNSPSGLAVDSAGNVLVADTSNDRIRRITAQGLVSTFAGSGSGTHDGPASQAQFNWPKALAVDGKGDVLVADSRNHSIRRISTRGVVSTLAGNGQPGFRDGSAFTVLFNGPSGVVVDGEGNVLVADTGNHRIRRVTPLGVVSTLAGRSQAGFQDGPGSLALFSEPHGLVLDHEGNLLVSDSRGHRIRKMAPRSQHGVQESKSSPTWRRCIRGPAESPFSGGLFELLGRVSGVCFAVPIFHCNVDPQSGEVGFAESWAPDTPIASILKAVSDQLVSPDLSPQAIKNQEALALCRDNCLEYDARARKEVAESLQRNLSETEMSPEDGPKLVASLPLAGLTP